MLYLFSYGTLQLEAVQLSSFGRKLKGKKDILRGYKLAKIEIRDKSVLAKSGQKYHPIATKTGHSEDAVEGIVFEISTEELSLSDSYEVADYVRVQEALVSGKVAWVYVGI